MPEAALDPPRPGGTGSARFSREVSVRQASKPPSRLPSFAAAAELAE